MEIQDKIQKQHDLVADLAGRNLEEVKEKLMIDHQYKLYLSMDNNPIAEFKTRQLDRKRAALDKVDRQQLTEAIQAAAAEEILKIFKNLG